MASFSIRPATASDAAAILHLIRELARYERVDPDTTVLATEDSLREQLNSPHPPFSCFVAECNASVVGMALYFFNYSTWAGKPGIYLEDLFVLPEMRGLGIGKALLVRVAKEACDRGCARLDWAVLDWNRPAREFYASLGAACLDEWKMYRLTGPTLTAAGSAS